MISLRSAGQLLPNVLTTVLPVAICRAAQYGQGPSWDYDSVLGEVLLSLEVGVGMAVLLFALYQRPRLVHLAVLAVWWWGNVLVAPLLLGDSDPVALGVVLGIIFLEIGCVHVLVRWLYVAICHTQATWRLRDLMMQMAALSVFLAAFARVSWDKYYLNEPVTHVVAAYFLFTSFIAHRVWKSYLATTSPLSVSRWLVVEVLFFVLVVRGSAPISEALGDYLSGTGPSWEQFLTLYLPNLTEAARTRDWGMILGTFMGFLYCRVTSPAFRIYTSESSQENAAPETQTVTPLPITNEAEAGGC